MNGIELYHKILLSMKVHEAVCYLVFSQVKADAAREAEMLLIKMREKAEIFNRIFSKDNPLSDEEVTRLLEEARLEDSKDGKVVRLFASRYFGQAGNVAGSEAQGGVVNGLVGCQ